MIDPATPSASADISIDSDADKVYALVTNLDTLASLAEETETMEWVKGDAVRPGAVFKGQNRNGEHHWSTTCTVTDAQPGRTFGFDVRFAFLPIAHWQYDIAPLEAGHCRVTESTWDLRPSWFRRFGKMATGVADRDSANGANIKATLQRLKQHAEADRS